MVRAIRVYAAWTDEAVGQDLPSAPEFYRVALGNVGQHYYHWRDPTQTPRAAR